MNNDGDTLLVDADSRIATRWIILRAMSGGALVNDYRLRIVAGSDGLQNPGLRFTDSVGTLAVNATHDFAATHSGSGAITWSVTGTDDLATTLATINPTTGALTANGLGMVKITATVAADGTYRGATTSHTLAILTPANLAFTAAPGHLLTSHTTQFTATSDSGGAITWSIAEGGTAATIDPATGLVTAGATAETITVQATVAATDAYAGETLAATLQVIDEVDADGDGLIEIHDLTMLHNMRYSLAGTSYKTAADATGVTTGCPDTGCNGYELVSDLDFDKDGDGTTWSGDSTNGYTLDSGDSQAPYFITNNGGWEPIGTNSTPSAHL